MKPAAEELADALIEGRVVPDFRDKERVIEIINEVLRDPDHEFCHYDVDDI